MKKRIACLMLALVMLIGLIPVAAISASAAATGVSEAGVRVIKDFVGFHRVAYDVGGGVYRIGYGTPGVQGQTITEANADKLLREELDKIVKTINTLGLSLVQKRFDALVWYSYSEGTAWTKSKTVMDAINASVSGTGSASALANALCTWDYAGSFPDDTASRNVIQRRMAMANLYLTGSYSASSTGSLGYTVFYAGNDQNAAFIGGSKRLVQVYSGSYNNKIALSSDPMWDGYIFLGWYDNTTLVTGLGSSTAGKTLVAHWQKNTDDKVAANYTLPAYVIYQAMNIPETGVVEVYSTPESMYKIDEIRRDATITVVAEKMIGSAKWLQLASGGWVQLCNNISDVPTIIPATTVTITDDYVTVRKEPSATAAKVGTLKRGEKATIAIIKDGWGYCSQGWIFLAYTNYNNATTPDSTLTGGTSGVVSGATQVNVRTAPGVTNPLATKLSQGTKVTVYEQTTVNGAPWGHIDQGWIAMAYVTLDKSGDSGSGSNISTGSSAVVNSSVSLNVRSGPGTNYTRVATLAPGTSVVILRKETVGGVAWGLIDQGWINLNYVTSIGSSDNNSGSTGYSVGGTVVNCATGVNIRSAAGTTNALVGVAALGSRVNVSEIVKVNGFNWGHIERGWVCMDYVKLDSDFTPPDNNGGDLDNVVTTFQGYPAITKNATNLLESASVHANTILTLNANVQVSILARTVNGSNEFGKVTVGSKTGWIKLSDVTLSQVNAKVTAAKADAYESPSIRSQYYASLVKDTYVTIGNADGTGWVLTDGTLWGQIELNGNVAWIKLSDVTMFKENQMPTDITTLSGVGYMTGTLNAAATVYEDSNGQVTKVASAYTLPAGSSVNVLARNYVKDEGKTYAKVSVGSVNGWIDWDLITLVPVEMKANTAVTLYSGANLTSAAGTLQTGERITITSRVLVLNSIEVNHGVVDMGCGYINDDLNRIAYVILDTGKLTPTGNATNNNPSNPTVATSTVVTGTANGEVSIYEEAMLTSSKLLSVKSGSNITILNWRIVDGITWGKVQINKIVGWVNTAEISFNGLQGAAKEDSLKVYSMMDKASSVQILRMSNVKFDLYDIYFDGSIVWARINVGAIAGYVDVADLRLSTPNMTEDTSVQTVIAKGKINSVNATVNVTDLKGNETNEVKVLPKGTEVELTQVRINTNGVMWRVNLGSNAGWINMDCLSMYNAVATITEPSAAIYDDLTLAKTLYTMYRGEKVTIVNFKLGSDYKLYGEVVYGNTTGWVLLCDQNSYMYVSLVPGSTGTTIGGNTGNTGNTGNVTAPTTAPTNPTTPTSTAGYIVCSTTVNVRSGAGVENALVTTLRNGTNVNIYEKATASNGTQWARIDQGWVCMDYVRTGTITNVPNGGSNGNSGNVAIITTVPAGAIAVGYANEDIKVRTGTSLGYPEVGTISKKQSVVIYESKLDGGMSWGRTDNGWVCISYLTITGIGAAGSGTTGTIAGVGFTANVRGTASSGGALMAKVMITSKVVIRETVVAGTETWVRTDLGWINGQYVMLDATNDTTTPTTAPTTPSVEQPTNPGEEFVG